MTSTMSSFETLSSYRQRVVAGLAAYRVGVLAE
ncbi:hypothetical protein ABH926_005759 [Catenulispora sp. GP43]